MPRSGRHGGAARRGLGGRRAVLGLGLTLALVTPVVRDVPPVATGARSDRATLVAGHPTVGVAATSPGLAPRSVPLDDVRETLGADPAASPEVGPDAGSLAGELAGAVAHVDAYWTTHAEPWAPRYRTPALRPAPYGLYGLDTPPPRCGDTRLRLHAASFCTEGTFVAFGRAFMHRGYATLGRAWVYVVVAHEWGHAVQDGMRAEHVDVFRELQADCLAGVALRTVGRDVPLRLDPHARTRVFSLVSARPSVSGATGFGRPAGRPTEPLPGQHGTLAERGSAFADGWEGGTEACVDRLT